MKKTVGLVQKEGIEAVFIRANVGRLEDVKNYVAETIEAMADDVPIVD